MQRFGKPRTRQESAQRTQARPDIDAKSPVFVFAAREIPLTRVDQLAYEPADDALSSSASGFVEFQKVAARRPLKHRRPGSGALSVRFHKVQAKAIEIRQTRRC
jgi:hypothetical protein